MKPRYPVAGSAGAISTHDLGIAGLQANMPTYHDHPDPGDGDDDDDGDDDEDNGNKDDWM